MLQIVDLTVSIFLCCMILHLGSLFFFVFCDFGFVLCYARKLLDLLSFVWAGTLPRFLPSQKVYYQEDDPAICNFSCAFPTTKLREYHTQYLLFSLGFEVDKDCTPVNIAGAIICSWCYVKIGFHLSCIDRNSRSLCCFQCSSLIHFLWILVSYLKFHFIAQLFYFLSCFL